MVSALHQQASPNNKWNSNYQNLDYDHHMTVNVIFLLLCFSKKIITYNLVIIHKNFWIFFCQINSSINEWNIILLCFRVQHKKIIVNIYECQRKELVVSSPKSFNVNTFVWRWIFVPFNSRTFCLTLTNVLAKEVSN